MTNTEMISKFKLTVGFGVLPNAKTPQEGLRVNAGKPTTEEIEYIKAHKAEIIVELKAEIVRKEQEARDAKQARIETIKSGEVKIKAHYHDGEYLSGYTAHGEAAELLTELKLAKYIDGWGYHVDSNLVKSLSEEFTYQQAFDFAKPMLDAAATKKAEKEAERQTIFDKARETGEKQLLRQWDEECNDRNEDCSLDNICEWAMPNGTTKITRQHTW